MARRVGDVLPVASTVVGIPCFGLNSGTEKFKHTELIAIQIATNDEEETDRYWNAIVSNGGRTTRAADAKTSEHLLANNAAGAD
jgi:predicted 3-demethylubiquinone-9 3-methyltransferase (glyoxalase superfamily)